ncbi:MBL fold metallo-hydrolase [Stenotrophomonas maltophilia]|nr:MBL fold metallo-hydrolase [Stenotrophomonas maltophilia]
MRIQELAPDVLMFVGDQVESVATAFVNGDQVLLVDALGSEEDATWLREVLQGQMGKRVRLVAATHSMSDHICGMTLFPEALTLAHRHHRHAFLSQNRPVASFYRDPDIVFDNFAMRWGRHQLRFLYNPGKTMDHMSVDVPTADLVCVGDNIIGNIVYLSRSDPALQRAAIGRIQQFERSRVVGGHIGVFDAPVLGNALHYLRRIQEIVVDIRLRAAPAEATPLIATIRLEECIASGVTPTAFEREWHGHNLTAIVAQSIFSLDAALAAREQAA